MMKNGRRRFVVNGDRAVIRIITSFAALLSESRGVLDGVGNLPVRDDCSAAPVCEPRSLPYCWCSIISAVIMTHCGVSDYKR